MLYVTCPICGYYQAIVAAPVCCECAGPLTRSEPVESDADLMGALLAALEDDESGFYVWTPGTPLLLTRSEA